MLCPRCSDILMLTHKDFERDTWTSVFCYWCTNCKSYLTERFSEDKSEVIWGDWRNGELNEH